MSLAQTEACPPPCNPAGEDFDADTDHEFKTTIDETKDVIEDEKEIVEEVVDDTGVRDLLVAVVGCDEAGDIVDNIVKPMVELEIADMLPIDQALEVIKTMNDDEKVEVKDQLPTLQSVWETIVNDEKRATDEPNIAFHDKPTEMTPQQMENSMVTQIEGPNGEMLDVIVVNKAGVVVDADAPCPEEDLEEIAEEVAKEVVDEVEDEIEEEAKPEPKPEPEPEKPKKKKVEVYKTTVEKMSPDPEALETLVMAANGKPVILDFQYDACGYCQEIAPAFEDLMKAHSGTPEDPLAFFRKVDIFEHRERL